MIQLFIIKGKDDLENTFELANEFFHELQKFAQEGEYFEICENGETLYFSLDILLPADMKAISTMTCQGKSGHISDFLCPWCDCYSSERGDPSIFLCKSCAKRPQFKQQLQEKLPTNIEPNEKLQIEETLQLIMEDEQLPCFHRDIVTGNNCLKLKYNLTYFYTKY